MLFRNLSRIAPRVASRLPRGRSKVFPPEAINPSVMFYRMELPRSMASQGDDSKWNIHKPKKGTGFDNFTPREKPSKDSDGDADKQKEETNETESKKSNENKDFSKDENTQKDDQGGGKRGSNEPNGYENYIPAIVSLLVMYFLTQLTSADEPAEGHSLDREISWHDFLRLLQQQDILKVVVTDDRQSARVYVKSNAKGLVRQSSQRGFGGGGGASSQFSSYEEQRRQRAANRDRPEGSGNDEFHQQEQERLEGLQSNVALQNVVGGSGGRQGHIPFFYRMHIGSVDAFERKLDEAQRALKRDPNNDVPVQYLPDSVSNCDHPLFARRRLHARV